MGVLQEAHLAKFLFFAREDGAASEIPIARRFGLWRIQDWIGALHQRVEPVCLRVGPFDPLSFFGRQFSVP